MATRFTLPIEQLMNSSGSSVASGWKLNFYSTGTTTQKDTFSDDALTSANSNPVVADSAGRFGDIFLESGTYRVILTDADDVQIWDADPVAGSVGSSGEVSTKTAAYTVTIDDATKIIAVDTSGGDVTITLPASATAGNGFEVTIKKTTSDSNTVIIDGDGSETIDGQTTHTLSSQYDSVTLRADASNWQILSLGVAPGTSGQLLQSQGAGLHPQWSTGQFTTGDVKLTLKSTADTGWVLMDDGTIGNASSGGTTRANADTEDLFTLLWNNVSDTYAPVSSGRGGSAAADFAADKTITLPAVLGRALAVSGAGSGLTSRSLGETAGTEDHTITESELASHNHANGATNNNGVSDGGGGVLDAGYAATTGSTGSDSAHNNMQPSAFWNVMIKL